MVWLCTREDVKRALDSAETARNDAQVDRAIDAATLTIEGLTHRRFYPQVGTRHKDWPSSQVGPAWRLYLDADELISVTTLVAGAIIIASSDYFLEPANSGPPYNRIEIDLGGPAAFGASTTRQRAIAITGVFGHSADEAPAGALSAAVSSTTATTIAVTDSAAIGVGHIIRVDSERMIVTGKSMVTTGQTLQTPLTASAADVTVTVTTGSAYLVDEVILLDSERMLIVDIAANQLTVKRAWDGSVLTTHTGSTVYALRTLTVERGALGTTAATHSLAADIARHVVPGPVRQLAIAEALTALQQEGSGYGRTVGSGDNQREASGKGLADLRAQVYTSHGRKARSRAV